MRVQPALRIVFWIAPILFQLLVALAMICRGLVRNFPVFFFYTALVCGRDLILFVLRNHSNLYVWVYWIGEPVAILLGLAVIYEVLWHLIRPYSTLRSLGIGLSWLSLAVALLTGLWMLKASRAMPLSFTIESVLSVELAARFVQVGVLIAFMIFISHLGFTWKDYTSGIVAGFGVTAGLQLALLELKSLHAISDNIFVLLKSAAYGCAVLIWALYFVPRRAANRAPKEMPETDLARLDQLLRRYLSR